nr:hypothetical protein [uncultured Campylobacter sp.]
MPIKFTYGVAPNFTKSIALKFAVFHLLVFTRLVKFLGKFAQTPNVTAKSNLKMLQKSVFCEI